MGSCRPVRDGEPASEFLFAFLVLPFTIEHMDFTCPKCHVVLSAPDSEVGEIARCAGCGNVTYVPAPKGPSPAASNEGAVRGDGGKVLWTGRPSRKALPGRYCLIALGALLGLVLLFRAGFWPRVGVLVLLLDAGAFAVVAIARRCTQYRITDQLITYEAGVFDRTTKEIPVSHVREVQLRQGLLARMMNVGTLAFSTSASGDTEVVFVGVRDPHAVRDIVREYI